MSKVIIVGEREGAVPRYFTSKHGALRFHMDPKGAYKYHSKSHAQHDCDLLNKQEQSRAQQLEGYVPYVYTLQKDNTTIPAPELRGNGFQLMWLGELDDVLKAGPLPGIHYPANTDGTHDVPGQVIELKTYNGRMRIVPYAGAQERLYRELLAHSSHTDDSNHTAAVNASNLRESNPGMVAQLERLGVVDIESRVPGLVGVSFRDPLTAVKDPQHFHAVYKGYGEPEQRPHTVVIEDAQTGEQVRIRGEKLLGLLAALEATGMRREDDQIGPV